MPNLPQQETIVQYVTSNLQTQYTFAFYAPLPTDIEVYYQAPNVLPVPESQILALGSQYTVTYNADPTTGGYITLLFTPTSGYYLTINRQVMASLNTNFSNAQNFSGANLDAALDRLLLLCQQNQNYALQRNLSYIINTYLPNAIPYTQLPPLPQNFIWVGSGSGVVAAQVAQVPSASLLQSMLANNAPSTDGARLVGYYDTIANNPTTVDAMLTYLNTNVQPIVSRAFTFIGKQVLTGAGNYIPSAGALWAWVRGVGGAGGGAGATSASGHAGVGAGGAAGAFGEAWIPAATTAYVCGTGGLGGGAGVAGSRGSPSTFGTALDLNGGNGGNVVNNSTSLVFAPGELGGTVVTADAGFAGANGGFGWVSPSPRGGISGAGANSQFGAGGLPVAGGTSQNGNNGVDGGGGSGAICFDVANVVGGIGGNGKFIVFEFGYAA